MQKGQSKWTLLIRSAIAHTTWRGNIYHFAQKCSCPSKSRRAWDYTWNDLLSGHAANKLFCRYDRRALKHCGHLTTDNRHRSMHVQLARIGNVRCKIKMNSIHLPHRWRVDATSCSVFGALFAAGSPLGRQFGAIRTTAMHISLKAGSNGLPRWYIIILSYISRCVLMQPPSPPFSNNNKI